MRLSISFLLASICIILLHACSENDIENIPMCLMNGEPHGHVLIDGQIMGCQIKTTGTSNYTSQSQTSLHGFTYFENIDSSRVPLANFAIVVDDDDYENAYLLQAPDINHDSLPCMLGTSSAPGREIVLSQIEFTESGESLKGTFDVLMYCRTEDKRIKLEGDFIGSF